ncbi:MAG: hypothetical protein GKR89_37390, partial [Candidatus Latescibacteria bacterium]|nr:hypothetical protein [Candidatus Latescibacterota bacterium]
MKYLTWCTLALLMGAALAAYGQESAVLEVDPQVSKSIQNFLQLDRKKYFNLGHGGQSFETKVADPQRVHTYLNQYNMSFGRDLGLVKTHVVWQQKVFEDPQRPGFVDLEKLTALINNDSGASQAFQERFAPNIDVANHEFPNAYPPFMGHFSSAEDPEGTYPSNYQAAAELVAAVLTHGYQDWSRPATYEPINEPHWSLWKDQRLADLHLAIKRQVKADKIPTLIGGPCMAIPYFYKKNYTHLNAFTDFIDNTDAQLDFYSFHTYDFLQWDKEQGDFLGRVTSGLPLEGVLDAISNYTVNKYGRPVQLVLSEHGGYLFRDEGNVISDELAGQLIGPGNGFTWEMRKRSVGAFVMVSSAIANTMTFLNHPHIIKKAVPFILLESFDWNPQYYSSLLVANNFTDKTQWQEVELIYFYAFFADVQGRRVRSAINDPDIQHHAFVEGDRLYIALNNLATKKQRLEFRLSGPPYKSIAVKKFGRNQDFTPYFEQATLPSLDSIEIKGRESLLLMVEYAKPLAETRRLNERVYYGDQVAHDLAGKQSASFVVDIPQYKEVVEATLRIGVGRPPGTDRDIDLAVNGHKLEAIMEDAADYLEGDEYGSSKSIPLPKCKALSLLDTNLGFIQPHRRTGLGVLPDAPGPGFDSRAAGGSS